MLGDLKYLENDADLPKLPVPSLEETVERFLGTVEPLCSEQEFQVVKGKAYDLLDPSKSIGTVLHQRLVDRANDPEITSWIEEWWNDVAYLQNRQSICFHVNYYFGFRQIPNPIIPPSQTLVAAAIINSIVSYRNLIISGKFETDAVRGVPLCMDQFRNQFAACRYPGLPADYTKVFPLSESKHIIIASKGHYYKYNPYLLDSNFQTIESDSGYEVKSIDQIHADLLHLIETSSSIVPNRNHNIGILTVLERDDWHYARESIIEISEGNVQSLYEIESSAFLLALDDLEPQNYSELANACYCSNGFNRFYDKCFQVLVFKNGRYGFSGEHSLTDGTTDVRLSRHFVKDVETFFATPAARPTSSFTPFSWEPLKFDFNITLKHFIRRAWSYFDYYSFRQEIATVRFDAFGKNAVKKLRVSPDAFAQMAVQLAYYRLFDQFVATYESASTRSFAHGRTETARSISVHSVAWCRAMLEEDPRQLEGQILPPAEIAAMLDRAISA
ncbi:Carnitine O-acetyltransferase, mitochondrial, partial [Smittium mucronatum]